MTSETLRDVLERRARRADPSAADDPAAVVAVIRERAEHRRRTRRNATAAAGGVTLVAALVVGAVVLPSSGHRPGSAPAGGPAATSVSSSPQVRSSEAAAARSAAQAAVSAASSAAAVRSRAAASLSSASTPVRSLVKVTTPKAAAVAVGLVPEGWRYSGHAGPNTFYAPTSATPSNSPDFPSVIVVDVHDRAGTPDSAYPLRVDGRRVRYGTDSGVTIVAVVVDATTDLDIQLPASAPVTRSQALRIAGSVVLRSKAEKTHG
ncbi:hypothetical protein [uncultured Jatrophihabitans sp.]|uniref:hypothetical protein n=1 Tax=uncultured Jatrophihabitans sp. TaxID=1610747 RepID=UPI0035CBC065